MTEPMPTTNTNSEMVLPHVCMMLLDSGRGALWDELLARSDKGRAQYGTALMTHNGRNALRDLLDELLDALMYVTQYGLENDVSVWKEFHEIKRLAMWAKEKLGDEKPGAAAELNALRAAVIRLEAEVNELKRKLAMQEGD